MNRAEAEVRQILRDELVIGRRDHPHLIGTVDRLARDGCVASVLPGIRAVDPQDLMTRLAAIPAWDPDAVLLGHAAARLTFWSRIAVPVVTVATQRRRLSAPGFALSRRRIDPELVLTRGGLRLTTPALTALDLCSTIGGEAIDTVLRSRAATLTDLRRTLELTPHRRGNLERTRLLLDSRDAPWSFAERVAHRLLREAGITGWVANLPVPVLGTVYYLDIAFEAQRVALEIDGRTHHGPDRFDADRWRGNDLLLENWRVFHFSADTVIHRGPVFVGQVERALEL